MSEVAVRDNVIDEKPSLIEWFEEAIRKGRYSASLVGLNALGLKRFHQLGFPHKKHEMFTYVDTSEIAGTRYNLKKEPYLLGSEIVANVTSEENRHKIVALVDGVFSPALSDISGAGNGVTVTPLEEAIDNDPVMKRILYEGTDKEDDPFSCLNASFVTSGVKVDIEKTGEEEQVVELLLFSTPGHEKPVYTAPRAFVMLREGAKATIIMRHVVTGGDVFQNSMVDIIAEPEAAGTIWQLQNENPGAWIFSKIRAEQREKSKLTLYEASGGAKLARFHYEWVMSGRGASLDLKSLAAPTGKSQAHQFVRVLHAAPDCSSELLFKNILLDAAQTSVNGTVIVKRGATGTKSNQLVNNLMLSDNARANNKPNLMIYNDDVQCAHGATIGQFPDDMLFYIMSRGIDRQTAIEALVRGFAAPVLEPASRFSFVNEVRNIVRSRSS